MPNICTHCANGRRQAACGETGHGRESGQLLVYSWSSYCWWKASSMTNEIGRLPPLKIKQMLTFCNTPIYCTYRIPITVGVGHSAHIRWCSVKPYYHFACMYCSHVFATYALTRFYWIKKANMTVTGPVSAVLGWGKVKLQKCTILAPGGY